MSFKETYQGTLIAMQDFKERIVESNIEDQEKFMRELQEYLNSHDANGDFATFNYVFKQILKSNTEYRELSEESLKEKIKEKCDSVQDGKERKKFRNRIYGFLEESKSKPNRQCVIEVAVVLGLSLEELEELLQKGLFQTGITYSSYKELIAAYCLIRRIHYDAFKELIIRYEIESVRLEAEMQEKENNGNFENNRIALVDSIVLQDKMKNMTEEKISEDTDSFLQYLLSISESLKGYSKHALTEFYALFEEVRLTVNEIRAQNYRRPLYNYLAENIYRGERKTVDMIISDLKKRVDENIVDQLDELDRRYDSGEIKDYRKISYADVKTEFRRVYNEHKTELADDKVFEGLLDDAFPRVTSDENVIRCIYGGTYDSGGLMQNDGRYGLEIQAAKLPKQALYAPMSKDRYNYLRNMIDGYRKFNLLIADRKKNNPNLNYTQLYKLYPDLKKMEGRLRIPQRHEFLMLIYFLFKNSGDNAENNYEDNYNDRNIAKEFKSYASKLLVKVGYYPIYEGNMLDVLLMGCLVNPDMTYHEFIRYALAPEEEW